MSFISVMGALLTYFCPKQQKDHIRRSSSNRRDHSRHERPDVRYFNRESSFECNGWHSNSDNHASDEDKDCFDYDDYSLNNHNENNRSTLGESHERTMDYNSYFVMEGVKYAGQYPQRRWTKEQPRMQQYKSIEKSRLNKSRRRHLKNNAKNHSKGIEW